MTNPLSARELAGRHMLRYGVHMGDKVDAGRVQDILEDYIAAETVATPLRKEIERLKTRTWTQYKAEEVNAAEARAEALEKALREIRDNGTCECSHDDVNCCARTGEPCPSCEAAVVLDKLPNG